MGVVIVAAYGCGQHCGACYWLIRDHRWSACHAWRNARVLEVFPAVIDLIFGMTERV